MTPQDLVDVSQITCLNMPLMAKPGPKPKPLEDRWKQVGLKLPPEVFEELARIAINTSIDKPGTVARLLFMRGFAAYERDGRLTEPESVEATKTKTPAKGKYDLHFLKDKVIGTPSPKKDTRKQRA